MKVWPSDPKSQLRKSESHEDGSGGGEPEGDQQPGQGEVHAFLHTACAGAGGEGSDEGAAREDRTHGSHRVLSELQPPFR